jgi:hypothetical protein
LRGDESLEILADLNRSPKLIATMHGPSYPTQARVALLTAFLLATAARQSVFAQGAPSGGASQNVSASIGARTAGLEKSDGFIPLYLDTRQGKLLLELPRDSTRALLVITQATGLGSNPVGIDRGSDGEARVVRFDRDGERVLVVFENWNYRSSAANNAAHQRSVEEAFPPSTVASLPLVATEGGRLLVDASDLVIRDWNRVAETLASSRQGTYTVARDRSSIFRPYTKAFPDNTEIDVALTFTTNGVPGPIVDRVVPEGHALTLRQHMTLAALPNDGYTPRASDPRVGYFGIAFNDYAQPVQRPLQVHWIARHRLERVNPADPNSPIKNPIVYYVDRGIPEPLRTATLEGVRWWEQAFDRAGLRGGFKVELLPEGVDPMDIRYNVVQWENRNERGWSVGGAVTDPRTGEMLKGMARLDSHRARTDYNLYAGLMGADAAAADTAFVLARVRQVSAHEVGHTLGLAHNYIASSYERGSVMDYPPPRVSLTPDGRIDLSQAYAVGPGAYDVWAIHWGYGIFPKASEADSLKSIIEDGLARGYLYLSDADARPEYGSDPRVSLWDDRESAMSFLENQMAVRRVALSRFGERNIRVGDPITLLQERFVPVYFMHRFALNGTTKAIGGMEYANAVRGDRQQVTHPLSATQQRAALALLLQALKPAELAIPDTVLTLMAPGATNVTPPIELFGSRTRPAFDELGAARTLAQMIVDGVLQRDRAARLVEFGARGSGFTLGTVIDALVGSTWRAPAPPGAKLAALQRVTQRAVADRLLLLAADSEAAPEVRAMAELQVTELRPLAAMWSKQATRSEEERAHWLSIAADFGQWIDKRQLPNLTRALVAPPGDPF